MRRDDPGDPFDFREPPAPLPRPSPPAAPGGRTPSPFEFRATDVRSGRRSLGVVVRAGAARVVELSSPGAVLVGAALLVVAALLVAVLFALL